MPLVSVLMTVYNSDKFLNKAIDSILEQTYENLEFLIVNDGSTDKSAEIVRAYKDPRIVFLENDGNKGIVYSRNRLLDISKGKYLAVLDSDDVALPTRLEKQVEFMESHPEYGMCGTYFHVVNSKGQRLYNVKFPVTDKELKTYLWFGNSFCHSTVMMRRDIALEFKYPESFPLNEDYALWKRIAERTKIYNLPIYTTLYRLHSDNVSARRYTEMFEKNRIINGYNLAHFGFQYTESDLDVYSHFIHYDYAFFKDKAQFKHLESLLGRIITHLRENRDFQLSVVLKLFLDRWYVICYKTKNYKFFVLNKHLTIGLKHHLAYFYDLMVTNYRKKIIALTNK